MIARDSDAGCSASPRLGTTTWAAQLLEDGQVVFEGRLVQLEDGELFVGVGRYRTEAGEVLCAARHPPLGQSLVEYTGEDGDPLGVVRETAPLSAETTAWTVEIDNRRQIEVDAEVSAGGAGRFSQSAHRATSGGAGCARRRQLAPQRGQPVDHAALEVCGDERPRLELPDSAN